MSREQLKAEIIEAVKQQLSDHKQAVIDLMNAKENEVLHLLGTKEDEIIEKVNSLVDKCTELDEQEPPQVMNMTITIPPARRRNRVA
jgi:hypothetical protein